MEEISYCSVDVPMYDSYIITQHIISIVSLIVNMLTAYCILFRSYSMGCFKYVLLYHIIVATILDILLSYAILPVILVPYVAGYPLGFLKFVDTDILAILAFSICGFVITSIIFLFAYRHYQILPYFHKYQLSRRNKVIGIIGLHIYVVAGMPYVVGRLPMQHELKVKLVQSIQSQGQCVLRELLLPGTFVGDLTPYPYVTIAFVYMSTATCISSFFIINALRCLNTMKHLSNLQKNLQRKYFFVLMLQISVPVIVIFIPVMFMIGIIANDVHDQSKQRQATNS